MKKHILKISTKKILLKILFPKKLSNEIITAAFVTTSGGIVGGDKLDIIGKTCKKSEIQLYQQAAEKFIKIKKTKNYKNFSYI
jgi:Urease accessory protein UreH